MSIASTSPTLPCDLSLKPTPVEDQQQIVTPLHEAVESGDIDALKSACKSLRDEQRKKGSQGAHPDYSIRNEEGLTPLHCAAKSLPPNQLALLLKEGANPLDRTPRGATALHLFVQEQLFHLQVGAQILCHERPALIDQEDENGDTPLHLACRAGSIDAIRTLMEEGANPQILNHAGNSPAHTSAFLRYQATEGRLLSVFEIERKEDSPPAPHLERLFQIALRDRRIYHLYSPLHKGQKVITCFFPTDDSNGSFRLREKDRQILLGMEKIAPIYWARISGLREMVSHLKVLEKQGRRISLLLLAAHGRVMQLIFGSEVSGLPSNERKLTLPNEGNSIEQLSALAQQVVKLLRKLMLPDAVTVVRGCSTGSPPYRPGIKGYRNFATTWAHLIPGRMVFAPNQMSTGIDFHITLNPFGGQFFRTDQGIDYTTVCKVGLQGISFLRWQQGALQPISTPTMRRAPKPLSEHAFRLVQNGWRQLQAKMTPTPKPTRAHFIGEDPIEEKAKVVSRSTTELSQRVIPLALITISITALAIHARSNTTAQSDG